MAVAGRLTRALNPRWIASKSMETSSGEAIEQMQDRDTAISHLAADNSCAENSATFTSPSISKLGSLVKASVSNLSRQMLSTHVVRSSKRSDSQEHSISSGQSLADAMTECHTSINQYYGLAHQPTVTLSNEAPAKVKTDRKQATIASKQARIVEAKRNRLSMADTERKMQSLTVNALAPDISLVSRATRLAELCNHVKRNPSARLFAIDQRVVPFLLSLRAETERQRERRLADTKKLNGIINETLSVLGHAPRLSSKGIKILTIDGGGTKGLVAIETLKQLEIICRAPIHTLFDYICGVSTGGLLAVLVGSMKLPLDRCEEVYKDCSQKIFTRGTLAGTANLIAKHSYYDMAIWEGILRDELGTETSMLSTVKDRSLPRVGLVSTVVSDMPYNYVFRNYNHSVDSSSQYPGSCNVKVWEAIRASSAAPGYFEEFKIGRHIHQDGGVLNNNPTAIALHEAKAIWSEERLQCIVSVGNGRYEPGSVDMAQDMSSLRHKVGTIIHSATNTEGVHTVLNDLLPADTYYRFNPYMSEEFLLNEIQEERLQQMQFETQQYLRRNASKLNRAGQQLSASRSVQQRLGDWTADSYSTLASHLPSLA
ncbi:calcium-independent phospholipase A2-gamma-like [Watersipora subatra]|uniref:calcium-independent phospholipase A2-gamma-like n=1 Tax=Watersipora subatra TaxID=2589382 RepID=UPI00355AF3C3